MQIARGVAAVLNINFEGAEALITQYSILLLIDPELVTAEMNLLWVMVPDGQLSSTMMARVKEQLLKGLYPNFCKLYRLALCMPVGTASCERSFSAMRRIRNYLRSTMSQDRFSNFSLLNIESDLTAKLYSDDVLNQFDSISPRSLMFR